ncbi:virulence-associated protein [Enterococcus phage vB_OCPT_Ben]|uniref:Virulence-associated protein n=1 Tax=Enterococcus phage vB_OCPT_Ben TaxID=2587819 RepID=A0A4Y5TQ55_9CAUD|nr:virulence-associated protein [Enterococcus phage vB_OCPT_Ben]UKM17493.1 virulence-associated protein [Enterococcus phage UTI-EfS3]
MAKEITNDDLKKAPYLDRFDPNKNRTRVLFKPDKPLQQAELNELQAMQDYALSNVAESVFSDGDIQTGMEYILQGTTLTVKKGKVFLGGKMRNFNEQSIEITGTGTEYIGVKLVQKVITAEDDPTLLDQTSGVPSHFSEGADRLEETVVLGVNDDEASNIYRFENGQLYINPDTPEMDKINKVLAERTYDESGSYRVRGFDMYTEVHPTDPNNKIQLVIDSGRAYVLGFKVDKPTTTRIDIDKSRDLETINNEGFYYSNETRLNKLGNAPVSSVDRVTAQVEVAKEQVSRGVVGGGTDYLKNTSVTKVVRVWTEGSGAHEYRQGEDFQLVNGQAISWAPTGQEPPAGGTYFVQYVYNKTMIENTDYKVTVKGEGDNREWYIDFNEMTGSKPVDESLVNVDYKYFLARKDLIVLDHNGNFTVHKGQPNAMRLVDSPNHIDPLTLNIGTVLVYPDSSTAEAKQWTITRLTMEELQKLSVRVDNMEYNQAVFYLDQPAMAGENPIYLRGVFSDAFISLDKYDTSHPDATIAFDFDTAEITLPYAEINKTVPSIIEGSSEAHVWGRLVTAPFTEEVGIRQPFATEAMNVNPYNTFNKQGVLTLNPSADNWIEEERITITKEETSTMTIRQWWRHGGASWTNDEMNLVSNVDLDNGMNWSDLKDDYRKSGLSGTTLSSGGQQTKESMIEFMRQIDVEIYAENLEPNANNLVVSFDGLRVPVTPSSGYRKGSQEGTGMANADGTFKGVFKIPAGVRCGTREVSIRNDTNLASTTFTAQGTMKTTEDIIIRTHVTINLVDPLAQSFSFNTNRIATSFDVFFASKDSSTNIICQVRGISEGGQPNKTVYAERVLKPSEINVSDDASVATKITFDDPLMCKAGQEYCLVFITDSDKYTMWIATMGQNRIDDPTQSVNSNPYLEGVLYSSSNASAWSIHQMSDLKFTVYTAKFNEEAVLEFDVMRNINVDRVVLMSTYLTPANTGCKWDMKIVLNNEPSGTTVNDKPWVPIANYVDLDVNQIAREVKLRATFKANQYISPMLALDDIMFAGFLTALKGSYVSRTIDLSEAPYNTVKMSYEQFTPAGTTVVAKYSTDEGKTWKTFTTQPTTTQRTQDFVRVDYVEKINTGGTFKSIKFRLDMSTQNSFLRPRVRRLMTNMTDK